jgi:crossover junction endodeoxyribonuclease RusA
MIYEFSYPVSNNRNVRFGNGRAYTSPEAKAYKLECGYKAKVFGATILNGDLWLNLYIHPKIKKNGEASKVGLDIDNICKVLFDALNGVLWHDDKQIKKLHIEYAKPVLGGRITLQVRPLEI